MPETVYDAHDRLLFRVRDDDRDRVIMLLQMMWIAYRPISVATAALLLDAREFLEKENCFRQQNLDWETDDRFRDWVIKACGGLVTVYDGHLFFIHQTAKGFPSPRRSGSARGFFLQNTVFASNLPTESWQKTIWLCGNTVRGSSNGVKIWKQARNPAAHPRTRAFWPLGGIGRARRVVRADKSRQKSSHTCCCWARGRISHRKGRWTVRELQLSSRKQAF